eukprot:CAMPEP_0117611450 /NCGR_PEP_ID=MMETSP0784-20121206/82400_1 /TAXON_ID=39447 /ORGANISM="" /LENGTH=80 /DNA_ID=CAMNT_0005414895 /DNA_START=12 /DNA_END=251 /DNA_ORIENTATION=-
MSDAQQVIRRASPLSLPTALAALLTLCEANRIDWSTSSAASVACRASNSLAISMSQPSESSPRSDTASGPASRASLLSNA